jgi:hypothetical protein
MTDQPLEATLPNVGSILAGVQKALAEGISVAEMAEKVLAFVSPTDAAALETLIKVLQEAQKLL